MPPKHRRSGGGDRSDESGAIAIDGAREFAFSDADFRHLAQVAYDYAGIALARASRIRLQPAVGAALRALGLSSFHEYREYLAESDREIESFINSISTNHTKFFREGHHFESFRTHCGRPIRAIGPSRQRPPPQSLVRRLLERRRAVHDRGRAQARDRASNVKDVRILATDIDTDVLGKAAPRRNTR